MPENGKKKKTRPKVGVGVLAVSTKKPGKILLVTTRQSKNWALPKGHVERLLGLSESARREAYEEAGVRGRMTSTPIGSYIHQKSAGDVFRVRVFKLHVQDQRSKWPEKKERQRRWVSLKSALKLVSNPSLRRFIREQLAS